MYLLSKFMKKYINIYLSKAKVSHTHFCHDLEFSTTHTPTIHQKNLKKSSKNTCKFYNKCLIKKSQRKNLTAVSTKIILTKKKRHLKIL